MSRRVLIRLALVVGASALLATAIWVPVGGAEQLESAWRYKLAVLAALAALVASIATLALQFLKPATRDDPAWSVLWARRPTIVSVAALITMLALGFVYCDVMAIDQGERRWEPADEGAFLGWVAHFVIIGALLVGLWLTRPHAALLVVAPVVAGALAFLTAAPRGWVVEDADFRDDATIADGLMDVVPHTVATAVLLGAVLLLLLAGRAQRRPR